jgi:CRP-like cAMP-binding protein
VIATQVAAWAEDAVFAVLDLEHRPIIARIAGHILELADGTRDGRIIAYVSHKRLADIAGTAREVVTRSLRQLREAGLIETTPGTVSITDRFRLSAIARGDSELS